MLNLTHKDNYYYSNKVKVVRYYYNEFDLVRFYRVPKSLPWRCRKITDPSAMKVASFMSLYLCVSPGF